MPFIKPLKREQLAEIDQTLEDTKAFLGFIPNDVLTMGHNPESTKAFMDFCLTIYSKATLPQPLLHLVGLVTSAASGCRYCTAHTANKSFESGIAAEKIEKVWEFGTSDLFDNKERAALNFALNAGQSPSEVTENDYVEMRKHFSESEIVELLFIICQFGFWNRWNDTVGTQLEDAPKQFSEKHFSDEHWTLDKHA